MPTYEYHCDGCDHEFDELQSFSDAALTKCPKCKKKKLRRLFGTGASIIFKGSGFYETDYRSQSYKDGAKAESDATKPAEKTDSADGKPAKTETKTESKSPGKGGAKGKAGKTGTAD